MTSSNLPLAEEAFVTTFATVLTLNLLGQMMLYIFPASLPEIGPYRQIINVACMTFVLGGSALIAALAVLIAIRTRDKRVDMLLQFGGFMFVMSMYSLWAFAEFELGLAIAAIRGALVPAEPGLRVARHAVTEAVALAEQEHGAADAFSSRGAKPGHRLAIVLGRTLASVKADAEAVHGRGIACLGRRSPQPSRFDPVLVGASSEKVAAAQEICCAQLSLLSRQPQPADGRNKIARQALAKIVGAAQPILRLPGAATGRRA